MTGGLWGVTTGTQEEEAGDSHSSLVWLGTAESFGGPPGVRGTRTLEERIGSGVSEARTVVPVNRCGSGPLLSHRRNISHEQGPTGVPVE